jgi:hypothetical protein
LTVIAVPDWGPGRTLEATVTDEGYLVNRGRKQVYVPGRPLILTLRRVDGRPRSPVGATSVFRLRAAPDLRLARIFLPSRTSVFVVASTKRPPFSYRNVPGRRMAVWYSLDGGARWKTAAWTIREAAPAASEAPRLVGLDEQLAVERLLEQGLAPVMKRTPACSACTRGRVLRQTPPPGRRARRGSRVTIVLG